jgi:hypothetical protein
VRINFFACRYNFLFHPEREFELEPVDLGKVISQKFPCPNDVRATLLCGLLLAESGNSPEIDRLLRSSPALFSDTLGTVKGMVCHLDLTDSILVR